LTGSYPIPSAEAIYFDHHASTPLLPEVVEAMNPWLERGFGNPSNSLHEYGNEARDAIEWGRAQIAKLIGAEPEQIIFTSGATEANNLAIQGRFRNKPTSQALVTSMLEHESIAKPAHYLEKLGYPVYRVSGDSTGMITLEVIHKQLADIDKSENISGLVSIIAVHGEIGTINPIEKIAEAAHRFNTPIHTDAAQAVGKIPVDVQDWNVDFLTIAAHKMYGPKGIGALYIKNDSLLEPILYGAGHERGLRPGTENVPYIIGFGMACKIANSDLEKEAGRQRKLRDELRSLLGENIPDIRFNGHPERRHPGNLHLSLPNVNSLDIIPKLLHYALSVGSACHTDHPMDNPLIQVLNISEKYASGSIRIGLGRSNTEQQIRQFAEDLTVAYEMVTKDR